MRIEAEKRECGNLRMSQVGNRMQDGDMGGVVRSDSPSGDWQPYFQQRDWATRSHPHFKNQDSVA